MEESSQLAWMLDWIKNYPVLSNFIIFGVAFLESLVLVGIPVPGAFLIISFGALIALGYLDMMTTMLLCIAGAIAGDGVSYWIGRYYRDQLVNMWPFRHFKKQIKAGEVFFEKHGGKSVALGRFVGPIRAVIPTIAGMMSMTPRRFTIINVLSAIAWAPAYLLPGMVFGASIELASEVAIRLVALIFAIIILVLLMRWLIRHIIAFLQPRTERMVNSSLRWASQHSLLGPLVRGLIDPRHPESISLLLFAFILTIAGVVFFLTLNSLSITASGLDQRTYELMLSLRTPLMDQLMVWITMLGDGFVLTVITLAVLAWLLLQRNLPAAWHWLAAILFGMILTRVLKVSLQIPRPDADMYIGTTHYSFPSAHSTMAMLVYGFLAVIICREISLKRSMHVYVSAGILITLIAFSRLYLGAHWLSDVVGGLALGLIWTTLIGIAYRKHASIKMSGKAMVLVSLFTIGSGSLLHWGLHSERELARYAIKMDSKLTSLNNWPEQGWQQLPSFRHDLAKTSHYVFNLQWAGKLQQIHKTLTQQGWQAATELDTSSFMKWMSSTSPIHTKPVLPQVHNGKHESLAMSLYDKQTKQYYVIRLWHSGHQWQQQPIWLGQLSTMQEKSFLKLFYYPVTEKNFSSPLKLLTGKLDGFTAELHNRTLQKPTASQWQGGTLLIQNK